MSGFPDRIGMSFDRADAYEQAARVQSKAASSLMHQIAAYTTTDRAPKRILELGCGPGLLTSQLRSQFPDAEIVALDLSPRMIERARMRVPDALYLVMDAEYPVLDSPVDLICSNFCIQWFTDRPSAFARLSHLLTPGGRIEITTLARGSFAEWRAACDAHALPCAIPNYPDPDRLQADWPAALNALWSFKTFHDPVGSGRNFLHDLKQIGATATAPGIPSLTPSGLRRIIATFDEKTRNMTYEVAFGSARKARGVLVTGTDTGIGKTLVSAIVTRALHATYWKPFQTGLAEETGDTASVTALAGLTPDRVVPPAYGFQAPLSPEAAARREGVTIDPDRISLPDSKAPLVVEGAGGLMVPLNARTLLIDWMKTLELPVILVARSGLGTLNHTLLSLEAFEKRRIPVLGLVLNGVPNAENRDALERFGGVRVLAEIPPLDVVSPQAIEEQAAQLRPLLASLGF